MLTLELRQWMCHEHLFLDLKAPVTLVVGRNGIGKSAIIDAIEFALCGTGHVRGIRTKQELGARCVREGAAECTVSLCVEGVEITRTMDGSGAQRLSAVDGKGSAGERVIEGKLTEVQTWVSDRLGIVPERLRVCLSARGIFAAKEEDRRAVLFGAAADQATDAKSITAAFVELGVEGERVDQAIAHVLRAGWDSAYDVACEHRAQAKGRISALQETDPVRLWSPPWPREEGERPIDLSEVDREALVTRLQRWESRRDEAAAKSGLTLGEARARKEAAHQALIEAGEEVEGILADAPEGTVEELQRQHAQAQSAEKRLAESVASVRRDLARAEALAALPEKLEPPEVCTHLPGETGCVAAKTAIAKHLKSLRDGVADVIASLPSLRESVDQAEIVHLEAKNAVSKSARSLERAREVERRLLPARARMATAEQKVAQANEALAEAEEATTGGQDQSADFAREREQRARKTLEMVDKYRAQVREVETLQQRRAEIEDERDEWDAIAQALKPTGARSVIVRRLVEPFTEALNEVGSFLGPMRVASDLSIEMQIDGSWRHYLQLSDSQRLRLELAVAHALASAAMIPFLIFDRVDALDVFEHGRGAALKALAALVKGGPYTCALALAALGRPKPSAAPHPDVDTWWLQAESKLEKVTA